MTVIPSTTPPCAMPDPAGQPRRLFLPVAPHAIARPRFAPARKPEPILAPEEALARTVRILGDTNAPGQVVIGGPGDPLAMIAPTLKTIRLVKQRYPSITVEIVTSGMGGEQYAQLLDDEGVGLVTLRVDAVDAEILTRLFAWIRPGRKTIPLPEAAAILMHEQVKAVVAFRQAGIKVNIRTILYPGYNDGHLEQLAQRMASLGVAAMTIVPFRPEPGAGEDPTMPPAPDQAMLATAMSRTGRHLETQEEADAPASCPTGPEESLVETTLPKPSANRPNVAVVSAGGMEVDLHLGQASQALIYGPREDGLVCLLDRRALPESGAGARRWKRLADMLHDCFALLAASAGANPKQILKEQGITVLTTEGEIDGSVDVLLGGGKQGPNSRAKRR